MTTTAMELMPIPAPADSPPADLMLVREATTVLAEARSAAKALQDVISRKAKPVIFSGEQYLEFEDWQVLGRFYNITAKVVSTALVDINGRIGFEAKAVAFHVSTGQEISAAESMCLADERTWANKPLFQLRSMAQTRACAKVLRNVLGFVPVLAGYRATPAEEMDRDEPDYHRDTPRQTRVAPVEPPNPYISERQRKQLAEVAEKAGWKDAEVRAFLAAAGYAKSTQIPAADFATVIAALELGPKSER